MIEVAAVAGQRVDLDVLARALDVAADELDAPARRAGVGGTAGGRPTRPALVYRFEHSLVRETVEARRDAACAAGAPTWPSPRRWRRCTPPTAGRSSPSWPGTSRPRRRSRRSTRPCTTPAGPPPRRPARRRTTRRPRTSAPRSRSGRRRWSGPGSLVDLATAALRMGAVPAEPRAQPGGVHAGVCRRRRRRRRRGGAAVRAGDALPRASRRAGRRPAAPGHRPHRRRHGAAAGAPAGVARAGAGDRGPQRRGGGADRRRRRTGPRDRRRRGAPRRPAGRGHVERRSGDRSSTPRASSKHLAHEREDQWSVAYGSVNQCRAEITVGDLDGGRRGRSIGCGRPPPRVASRCSG